MLSGSLEENVMSTGPAGVSPLGPVRIAVSGAMVSTVQSRCAGVWSVLPAASTARTSKACGPCARLEWLAGDVQLANAATPSRHWNVAAPSGEANAKDAAVEDVGPCGPPVSEVSGATVSTVHSRRAGLGSGLPAVFTARTSKVCGPCARPEWLAGDAQLINGAPSSLHSNVEPSSVEANANDADVDAVRPCGPAVTDVSGTGGGGGGGGGTGGGAGRTGGGGGGTGGGGGGTVAAIVSEPTVLQLLDSERSRTCLPASAHATKRCLPASSPAGVFIDTCTPSDARAPSAVTLKRPATRDPPDVATAKDPDDARARREPVLRTVTVPRNRPDTPRTEPDLTTRSATDTAAARTPTSPLRAAAPETAAPPTLATSTAAPSHTPARRRRTLTPRIEPDPCARTTTRP